MRIWWRNADVEPLWPGGRAQPGRCRIYSWTLTTAKWDIHGGEGVSARPALVVLDEVHIEASPDGEQSRHERMPPVPVSNRSNAGGWPKARDLEADGSLSKSSSVAEQVTRQRAMLRRYAPWENGR